MYSYSLNSSVIFIIIHNMFVMVVKILFVNLFITIESHTFKDNVFNLKSKFSQIRLHIILGCLKIMLIYFCFFYIPWSIIFTKCKKFQKIIVILSITNSNNLNSLN